MSTTESSPTGEAVTVERRVEATADGHRATIHVRGAVEVPQVARVVDNLPAADTVEAIRIDPETEPARWTVADGRLVLEALVPADGETTVSYDVRAGDQEVPEGTVTVELSQPVEASADPEDVPVFRDAQQFDGDATGAFVSTGTGEDPVQGATAEATDDDVRRALSGVPDPEPDLAVDQSLPPLDLADPADAADE